jgi:hypothetical protein
MQSQKNVIFNENKINILNIQLDKSSSTLFVNKK